MSECTSKSICSSSYFYFEINPSKFYVVMKIFYFDFFLACNNYNMYFSFKIINNSNLFSNGGWKLVRIINNFEIKKYMLCCLHHACKEKLK